MKKCSPLGVTSTVIFLLSALCIFHGFGCVDITNKLYRYLDAAHELWNFNGSVLIAWKGRVVLKKSYGMANETIGLPNTPQTKFFIGSITKQFTATAILILEERGLVDLNRPVSTYLPDFKHPYADKITIHHLLTHSSGLPNYTDKMEIYLKRMYPFNPDELLNAIQNEKLLFEPGTDFLYSNTGYILLGAIIERVSGQSYEAFLHKEIFRPLGMLNTGYGRREAAHPDRADGYTLGESGHLESAVPIEFSFLHSAGALYSTVEDMLKWDKALLMGTILSPESIKKMIGPYMGNYGYGWFVQSRFGYVNTYHDGLIDGFNTIISRWPEVGLCIVVFSNDDAAPVDKMADGLAAICFGEEGNYPLKKVPFPLAEEYYDDYPAVYTKNAGLIRIISPDNGQLYIRSLNQPKRRILPQAPDTFFYDIDNTDELIFHRGRNNEIKSIEVSDGNQALILPRMADNDARQILIDRRVIDIDNSLLDSYVGKYILESNLPDYGHDFDIEIFKADGRIMAKMTEAEAVELFPNSDSSFFHKEADLQITFSRNSQGEVNGCTLKIGLSEYIGRKVGN
jgi:CubicO group peptidase (beta-lactamase class C family)